MSKDWVLFAQFVFQTKFNYSSHWHATAVLIYMYFFLSTHRTNFFWDPNYLSKPLLTSTLFTGEICRNKCTYFRRPTKRSAHFCCATGKEKKYPIFRGVNLALNSSSAVSREEKKRLYAHEVWYMVCSGGLLLQRSENLQEKSCFNTVEKWFLKKIIMNRNCTFPAFYRGALS